MTNKKIEGINQQIEVVRKYMNELSKEKELTDPEIIEISQKLDELLNEFERLKNKNT